MLPGQRAISYALSCSLLPGFEAAQHFLQSRQVPDNWKVDLSEILESSSSDEEDHNEDIEGKAGEEEEKEPEPEEVRLQYYFVISISLPWNRVSFKSSTYLSSVEKMWCAADVFRSWWCWKIVVLSFELLSHGYFFLLFDSVFQFMLLLGCLFLGLSDWHVVLQWLLWLKGLPELGTRLTEVIRGYLRPVPIERIPVLVFMLICEDIPAALYISCSRTPWLSPLNGLSMWESPQALDNNVSFFLLPEFGQMAIRLVFRHVPMATARSFGCEKAAGLAQWRCASSDGGRGWAHLKESSLLAGEGRARCTIIRPACEKDKLKHLFEIMGCFSFYWILFWESQH